MLYYVFDPYLRQDLPSNDNYLEVVVWNDTRDTIHNASPSALSFSRYQVKGDNDSGICARCTEDNGDRDANRTVTAFVACFPQPRL